GIVARVAARKQLRADTEPRAQSLRDVPGPEEEAVVALHHPPQPLPLRGRAGLEPRLVEAHQLVGRPVPRLHVRGLRALAKTVWEALVVDPELGARERQEVGPGTAFHQPGVVREAL